MKEQLNLRCEIQANASLIKELHRRMTDAPSGRNYGKDASSDRSKACHEFHARYDSLAFPGGYKQGLRKLAENDARTIDAALSFLEVRPYFNTSQYIATKLRRMLKKAVLSERQKERLEAVIGHRLPETKPVAKNY